MKRKYIFLLTAAVAFYCSVVGNSNAQSFEDALKPFWYPRGFGASSSSLSFNNTGITRDFTSVSANPANLGLVRRSNAFLSFQAGEFDQYGTLESNNELFGKDSYFRFDGFGIVYPVPVYQGSLVFGVAYVPVFQYKYLLSAEGMVSLGADTAISLKHTLQESGSLYSLRFAGAVELMRDLFLGLSINLYNGYRNSEYTGIDRDTYDLYYYDYFRRTENFDPSYSGWNISLGMLYNSPLFKLGLKIATPIMLKVKEKSEFTEFETYDDQSDSSWITTYSIPYDITYPFDISAGIAFSLLNYSITLDAAIHMWDGIKFKSNLYDGEIHIDPGINNDLESELHTTMDYGIGFIIPITVTSKAQIGLRVIPRPYNNLSNNEKNINILGIGFENLFENQISVGLSYQLVTGNQTIYNNYFGTATSQSFQDHQFTISTSILF